MNQLEEIKARVKGHTPGPWVYHSSSGRIEDVPEFVLHRFDVMAIEIAKVQESGADGHLIAAAPKLLAALEAVEERLTWLDAIQEGDNNAPKNANAGGIASFIRDAITEALQ